MLFQILVVLLSWQQVTPQECSPETDRQDKILTNHVIKVITSVSYGMCLMECSTDVKCHSFNYYLDSSDCELNNATHMSHPEDLIHRPHANYFLYSPRPLYNCSNSLCPVNETCFMEQNGITYKCTKGGCHDLFNAGIRRNGVYTIDPDGKGQFKAYCDMTTDGGGWTVFQRRQDGSVDFYLGWDKYKTGFGNLLGEFWLGNDYIHRLTATKPTLRIDLKNFEGIEKYAKYSWFEVKDESQLYKLSLGTFSGTVAGDSLHFHNNMPFSTKDRDSSLNGKCAEEFTGAWWYYGCHKSNLNGQYLGHTSDPKGTTWDLFKAGTTSYYYSMKVTEMKLRPNPFP